MNTISILQKLRKDAEELQTQLCQNTDCGNVKDCDKCLYDEENIDKFMKYKGKF